MAALTLYDIVADGTREATQADLDRGLMCEAAIGFWRGWQWQVMQLALEIGQGKLSTNEAEDRLRAWQPPSTNIERQS